MKIITIDKNNIENEHICCAIGNDKVNQSRALTKKMWMKERFDEGLQFKRLDDRGKVFVEYIPIEKVWKPLVGKNYMVINCLWVSGKFKGQGISTKLLEECVNDSKKQGMDGVVVVTGNKVKPFLTDKKFYEHNGFKVIDTAPPYFELLEFKINSKANSPSFAKHVKDGTCDNKNGFTFIYSHQCPFMEEYVGLLMNICKSMKIPSKTWHLKSYKEAQESGCPFGTLGIYFNGKFETHELMSENKFEKFIAQIT